MRRSRLTILVSIALISLIALAGCGPRATSGQAAQAADQSQLVVDLPALVIDVHSDGQTSLGGMSMADLGGIAGQDLSTLSVPPNMVDYMTASNIQHIQIANTPDGILILVNGEPIPSLAWDGEKLIATAEVLETFGAGIALLDKVLPLIQNLGIGVTMRLPLAEGTETIPLVVTDRADVEEALAAQQEFLDAVGTPPTFQVVLTYAEDGTWSVGDLTQAEWSQLAPVPWEMLNLPPGVVQGASASGVDTIGLSTNTQGIFISVNGRTLPYITWEDGRIQHVLDLAAQMGLMEGVMGPNPDTSMILQTVESLLPAVQASNVNLEVVFP